MRRLFKVHVSVSVNGETGVSILRPCMKTASGKRSGKYLRHDLSVGVYKLERPNHQESVPPG